MNTSELKEKINIIYLNIIEKINKFDKNIICLNGKVDSIKQLLIEEIKKELNINDISFDNEINNILEIYSLKLDININENLNKIKNEINKEIIYISDINKNNKLIEYTSKFNYKDEIKEKDINNAIEENINLLMDKYKTAFECFEILDKDFKDNILEILKINLKNSLNNLINIKPNWENSLNLLFVDIENNVINIYKNKLLEEKSYREIERHINNNFEKLRKEIDTYIENKKFIIYNINEYEKQLENLIIKLKNDLNTHLIILKYEKDKIILKTIPNGIYNIIPKHCENKAFEIKDDIIQLNDYNNSQSQQFEIKYSPINQFYIIKCLSTNKILSVDYNNCYNIIQNEKHYGNNQQWHIVSIGDNYEIISELNGYLIDINENNGISCKPKNGQLNQQFDFKFTVPSSNSQPQLPPPKSIYFPKVSYDGFSIVDALGSIGYDNSFAYRKKIAAKNGIEGYSGTPQQNIYMLNLLKQGTLIKP